MVVVKSEYVGVLGPPAIDSRREEVTAMATKQVYKSAKTGRFVKKSTVKSNPSTTVTQTVKTGKKK